MLTKKQRLEQYGITSDEQVLAMIERACDIFGNGANNTAKINIEKLVRHESHLGNYKDDSKEYGEGLSQFDRPTFDWVIEKLQSNKYYDERELFKKYYGFPLAMVQYDDLRHLPDVAIALTRLRYKFVPSVFPSDELGMYEYYKEFWNGGGAATREKWDRDTKDCFFKVGV